MDRLNGFLRQDSSKKPFLVTIESFAETTPEVKCQRWKPITLRRPFLLAVILVTLGLLALVQVLVIYDQRHDGILFATKISDLGTGYIFLYRYFPTIISVSYGLTWHWIDVDTRRIEPYRQLSKSGGAVGRDSLLLRYPTDLLAFVPLKAFRRKHWSVVISSSALVLVGMGLTPLQAAMFATETVTKSFAEPMQVSKQMMSIEDQAAQVTANYTYSVSNILWLNERLPRFMSKEAAFVPFRPEHVNGPQNNESWSAITTSFGMDLQCEEAKLNQTGTQKTWASSQGCQVRLPFGPDGMDVIGDTDPVDESEVKEFTPFFAGNQNHDGLADYYIGPYCPDSASKVFMVALAKNRNSSTDPPGPVTRLFCETSYYKQEVPATVRQSDGEIVDIASSGDRLPLPPGVFNTSLLEWQINSATQQNTVRSAIPSTKWPDQNPQLAQLPISFPSSYIKMTHIVGLAIGAYPMPVADYMDPQNLAASYQAIHRLLFARAMVDIMSDDFKDFDTVDGTRTYKTQAVRIVHRFAYAVECVLGIVALMAFLLMTISWNSFLNLLSDPDSMAAVMSLVKGQHGILEQYAPHDQSSWADLKDDTCESTYTLYVSHQKHESVLELESDCSETRTFSSSVTTGPQGTLDYPFEFSLPVGAIFCFGLVIALAAAACLYQVGLVDGIPLPAQNIFIRQVLENYIPTIIATLIEPVWVVLNRLLCLLQPFEELRSTNATPERSINLSYSSLPPQFVLFKALKARHIVLSAVCAMALLANVLAVALGGMFNEEILLVTHTQNSTQLYGGRFREGLENTTLLGPNPFYAAMANFTSETPMPAWTDDTAFYLPVSLPQGLNESDYFEVQNVPSFGIAMECKPLNNNRGYSWDFTSESYEDTMFPLANLTVTIPREDHGSVACALEGLVIGSSDWPISCSQQISALEVIQPMASKAANIPPGQDPCRHLITSIWARKPATSICANETIRVTDADAMGMVCKPSVFSQLVNVTVTGGGVVHDVRRSDSYNAGPDPSGEVIREAIRALSQKIGAQDVVSFDDWGGSWHSDTFPSGWITYAMDMMDSDSPFLDSNAPVPDFEETAKLFTKAYQKMFAIWLGLNHATLLMPAGANEPMFEGSLTQPEVRITVSRAMLILSSTILSCYIIVAMIVYARRPGKYLPRMPITMASDIAMFAASTAVKEMDVDTDHTGLYEQYRSAWHASGRARYGYGTFIGTDGKPHIGVERAPFVAPLP